MVADAARRLLPHLRPGELAIITPYAAQADHLRSILRDDEGTGRKMTIATVDAFQVLAAVASCSRMHHIACACELHTNWEIHESVARRGWSTMSSP